MEEGIEEEEKKRENFSLFSFYASSRARRVVHTWSESSDFFFFVAVFSIPRNNKKIHNQCLAKDVVDEPIDTATISNFPPSPLRWRLTIFFKEEKKRKKKSLKN